jgi:hypothetical protein
MLSKQQMEEMCEDLTNADYMWEIGHNGLTIHGWKTVYKLDPQFANTKGRADIRYNLPRDGVRSITARVGVAGLEAYSSWAVLTKTPNQIMRYTIEWAELQLRLGLEDSE